MRRNVMCLRFGYGFVRAVVLAVLCAFILVCPLLGCADDETSPNIQPHLISKPDAEPTRPIDRCEEMELSEYSLPISNDAYRRRIKELFSVVTEYKKKPVLADDDPVKPIYNSAVAMLDRYILNQWHTDADGVFRKVHTMHDWLIYNIGYDFELYSKYQQGEDVSNNPAFDIDGVFLNSLSVCDGLSRAMSFLCAIEGIDCLRMTGSYAGVSHAWNKVKIDGKWYNVDVTADCANYYTADAPETYNKQISHGFFLLSDKTIMTFSPTESPADAHIFAYNTDMVTYAADTDYDYYSKAVTTVGDKTYPLVVKSRDALRTIFYEIGKLDGKVGKIELKLDFEGKENVNDGDIYVEDIRAAYNELHSPDFTFSDKARPYFRYPNGVYLFLMYK